MQVTLVADEPSKCSDFYCNLLGLFDEIATTPYSGDVIEVRLRLRESEHCGMLISPGTPQPIASALRELPVLSLNIQNWAALYERLRGKVQIGEVQELPYGIQAHLVDPGGNHIVLFEKW